MTKSIKRTTATKRRLEACVFAYRHYINDLTHMLNAMSRELAKYHMQVLGSSPGLPLNYPMLDIDTGELIQNETAANPSSKPK